MSPAQAMHDRYKKIQALKQQLLEQKLTELTEDDPSTSTSGGASTSTSSSLLASGAGKKRVAHAAVSAPVEKNKAKQQVLVRQQHGEAKAGGTVAVTCPKGSSRTAHTPSLASVPKPLVTPDPHSKVPTSVRQRYLNSIIDECLKITGGEDELAAHVRAEKEEAECSRKASSRMIYLNLAVNCIKRLRTEATEEAKKSEERVKMKKNMKGNLGAQLAKQGATSHFSILAGKPGATGTWSIEKEKEIKPEDVDETMLYKVLTKYILTEEQLKENGFPRPDPDREGMVLMKVDERQKPDPDKLKIVAGSEDKRLCCRCGAIYRVDKA